VQCRGTDTRQLSEHPPQEPDPLLNARLTLAEPCTLLGRAVLSELRGDSHRKLPDQPVQLGFQTFDQLVVHGDSSVKRRSIGSKPSHAFDANLRVGRGASRLCHLPCRAGPAIPAVLCFPRAAVRRGRSEHRAGWRVPRPPPRRRPPPGPAAPPPTQAVRPGGRWSAFRRWRPGLAPRSRPDLRFRSAAVAVASSGDPPPPAPPPWRHGRHGGPDRSRCVYPPDSRWRSAPPGPPGHPARLRLQLWPNPWRPA